MTKLAGLLGVLALAACSTSQPQPAPSASARETTRTTSNAVRPAITKPAAAPDTRVLAALGVSADKVAASPVPVLATSSLESPVVMVETEYYAISAKSGGATIAIQGTRAAHAYDDIAPAKGNRSLRGGFGFVSVNENGRTASFVENGAAYSVDVECASNGDAKCASDAFVVGLVESLVYVGGGSQ